MPAALALGVALGLAFYVLVLRGDDPAAADDPAPLRAAEDVASNLVTALGGVVRRLWTPPAAAGPWLEAIAASESRYGIPQNLLLRQLDIESSHFAPDVVYGRVKSDAGAIGIAQFEPATAAELGVDPFDPLSSIDGAGRYMARLYNQFGTWSAALAAYNWGPGNVARKGLAQLPSETRTYIDLITNAVGVS